VFRLPNTLVFFSALLATLWVMAAGASPAAAHGGHGSAAAMHAADSPLHSGVLEPGLGSQEQGRPAGQAPSPASLDAGDEIPRTRLVTTCCCGSAACHSSVTLAAAAVAPAYETGDRLAPSPSPSLEQSVPAGLERPPRRIVSA
jgi:hypothetical protein